MPVAPYNPFALGWNGQTQTGSTPTTPLSSAGAVPYGNLAASTNQFMIGQSQAPFLANLPNYASNVAQRGANTSSLLQGQVPPDVIRQMQQQAAERGIATGSPGSDNSNASYLQSLGLTSLGLQDQGSKELSQSIADTPVPQLFNPASLFVPEHLAGLEQRAAAAGLSSGSRYPGFTMPSSLQVPGGRLGQGVTNPAYGSVGAGAPSGPIMGTTQQDQQIASIASGDSYANWWNQYGVPKQNNPSQGPVPQGFNSWEDANAFTDELLGDEAAAYGDSGLYPEYYGNHASAPEYYE